MKLKNTILSAMFISIGLLLPFLTGQIQIIGNMLLPMHIPVLLCGLICGPLYGCLVGLILPIFRSFIFEMPPLYPQATAMAFELATYGLVIGLLYRHFPKQNIKFLYLSMIISMISGRIVWGIAEIILLSFTNTPFTLYAFISGALLTAIPGIILQLIIIPVIMITLQKSKLISFTKRSEQVNVR